jgi:hydrogenase expression/formation protein HypC
MCLAVPMQIKELHPGNKGICDLDGSLQHVDLTLIDDAQIGDFVIIHAGFAIEKLDRAEADGRVELFEELAMHRKEALT